LINQEWRRSELLEKQYAERSTKGVVGNNGRKMPIIPRIRLIQPETIAKYLRGVD
jgi:hypothetical protein